MHELIAFIVERMKRMPFGLRVLTLHAMEFTLFVPFAFLPGGEINGFKVAYRDWWLRGGGPLFIAVGVAFGVIAYGFLRATRWSRPLYLIALASPLFVAPFLAVRVDDYIIAVCPVAVLGLYLFRRRTVCTYYAAFSQRTIA